MIGSSVLIFFFNHAAIQVSGGAPPVCLHKQKLFSGICSCIHALQVRCRLLTQLPLAQQIRLQVRLPLDTSSTSPSLLYILLPTIQTQIMSDN